MTLGKKIQTYRKNQGLTQRELAAKCHLATGTIQQYELGKRKPKIEQIQNIAKALDIPVEYLLGELTIGLMTEKDTTQVDYLISQNDKSLDFQKILFDNDCIIIKKDDCYILQKFIDGVYGKKIKISVSEYNTLVNDIDKTTSFFIKFILDKIFDSHDFYFNDNSENPEKQKKGGANAATPSDTE